MLNLQFSETDPSLPLPLPKPAAYQLKRDAIRAVHNWNEKFAGTYKKLSLGYNYLKNCKKVGRKSFKMNESFSGIQSRFN